MVKQKFNVNEFPRKIVMHVKTTEEYDTLSEVLDRAGRRWCTNESFVYRNPERNTDCIDFNTGRCGNEGYYKQHGYIVLEMSDFDWN